ncbi:MAG: hypothetical protein CMM74_15340 [Rhodospirillaceae bacterium]|nr:hypothetical protein [Rhodospirillaceae bacterium]|tara:strand:- start:476 stop:1600 length:1125 start_codon:yes stop_codon:yes gene_type:complete
MSTRTIDPKHLVREDVANLPFVKVGVKYEEFARQSPQLEIIRLASNENPYGPSQRVIEAIQDGLKEVHRYPDNTCAIISEKMGALIGVDPERLIFDCGAESIMLLLMNLCLRKGDKVVSFKPSFPALNIFSNAVGADVIGIEHEDDLTFSADRFCEALSPDIRMIYLCMPNNPTGSYFTGPEMKKVVTAASAETLFVLDEAYFEFSRDIADYPDAISILEDAGQPYISLRTMSKAYALAGMRVGYGICYDPGFADLLKSANTVFNIGVLTLKAAEAALTDPEHLGNYLAAVSEEKKKVEDALRLMGLRLFNSAGNFVCISLPTIGESLEFESAMQKAGIFIKGQKGRGEEGVLRITIGTPEENNRMISELGKLI